jgi:hypothetical protein
MERAEHRFSSGGADPVARLEYRGGWVYDIKADSNSYRRA